MKRFSLALCALAALATSACDSTSDTKAQAAQAPAARPLTIQEQVNVAKQNCERTTVNRGQWYRCWIPQAERIHEQMGYPHMDLLKVHTSELAMIARSLESGTFTSEQGEALVAQSMLRFNNAVAERENKSHDREMESWRQFRQYMQSPY